MWANADRRWKNKNENCQKKSANRHKDEILSPNPKQNTNLD